MNGQRSKGVVDRYIAAWTAGEIDAVRDLLDRDLAVEANLGQDRDFLETLRHISTAAKVVVSSRVNSGERTLVVYDCTSRDGLRQSRLLEYIDATDDKIVRVRRVYDRVSAVRIFPQLASSD